MKNLTITLPVLFVLISAIAMGQSPTITFTVTPTPVCACSSVTITSTTTNSPTMAVWYLPGGNPSTYSTTVLPLNPPPVKYCTPGIYNISVVVSNGNGSDSVSQVPAVIVEPLPVIKIYPPSGGICDTAGGNAFDTVYFNASGAATYSWAPTSSLSCSACPNPHAYPIVTTVYTVTATSAAGCTSTMTDTVTVGYIVAKIWGNDTICQGTIDSLLASGGSQNFPPGSTFLWSTGKTTSTIGVSPPVTTTYSCTIISGDGNCTSTGSFTVYVITCPSAIESIKNSNTLEIMPNPATTQLSVLINNPENESSTLIVTDILGREVYTQLLKPYQKQSLIDISTLSRGMYFLELKSPGSMVVQKFIKE